MDAEDFDVGQQVRLDYSPTEDRTVRYIKKGTVVATSRHAVRFEAFGGKEYNVYCSGVRAEQVRLPDGGTSEYHGRVNTFRPEWFG